MITELCLFSLTYICIHSVIWIRKRRAAHKRFINRGIRGPPPSLFYGNLYEWRNKRTIPDLVIDDWIKEYGNVFGYYTGEVPFLIVNDLDILQQVVITNSNVFRNRQDLILNAYPITHSLIALKDEKWKRVRNIISPTFSQNKVTSPAIREMIDIGVNRLVTALDPLYDPKQPGSGNKEPFVVDVYPHVQATTLDIIAKAALSMDRNVHQKGDPLFHAVQEFFSEASNIAVHLATLVPFLRPVMSFINNYLTAGKMTDMTVDHIKKQIIEVTSKRSETSESKNFLHSLINCFANEKISKDELIGNAHIILLAGYETTANAVTFTLYLLAKHQDIQEKLRREITADPDADYFDWVWLESLRIFPPVTLFLLRQASEDIEINGVYIEKGTIVQAPVWHIQHNEDVWPEPYTFRPERFTPENKSKLHPMAFLPFGAGHRICLGMKLADFEAKLIISRLITRYRVEFCPQTLDPLPLKCPTVIINPATPVYLRFVPI